MTRERRIEEVRVVTVIKQLMRGARKGERRAIAEGHKEELDAQLRHAVVCCMEDGLGGPVVGLSAGAGASKNYEWRC
jgi:hypothetical protein